MEEWDEEPLAVTEGHSTVTTLDRDDVYDALIEMTGDLVKLSLRMRRVGEDDWGHFKEPLQAFLAAVGMMPTGPKAKRAVGFVAPKPKAKGRRRN